MPCYVCGSRVDESDRCPACGTAVADIAAVAIPGVARLAGTALGARRLGGSLATLFANPPADVVPVIVDLRADDRRDDHEGLAATEPDLATGPASESGSLFAGPDGEVAEHQVAPIDSPHGPGSVDDLFGAPAPTFLTLGDPVQDAARGLDHDSDTLRRDRARRARERSKLVLDPRSLRPVILTGLLVLVTAWMGVQTLTESSGSATTTTLPIVTGPPLTHDSAALLEVAGSRAVTVTADECGAAATGPGYLVDERYVVTVRSVVDGDPRPSIAIGTATHAGTVVGWTWSPDLALIELSEPVTPLAPVPTAEALTVGQFHDLTLIVYGAAAPEAIVAPVISSVGGWAGVSHAVALDADAALAGALVMTGQGTIAGMVAPGPHGNAVAVTSDVLTPAIEDLRRLDEPMALDCATAGDGTAPLWTGTRLALDALALGSDPMLDDLHDGCRNEVWTDCDDLRFLSDPASSYYAYGVSCGERLLPEQTTCSLRIDVVAGAVLGSFRAGDCVILARAASGVSRPVPCTRSHDAEIVHVVDVQGLDRDLAGAVTVSVELEQQVADACAPTLDEWTNDRYWDRPLETAIIRPADTDAPFACFVYQPGSAFTESLA